MRMFRQVFRTSLVAGGTAGIVLNLANSAKPALLFSYYTIQSNLLCIALFSFLISRGLRSRVRISPRPDTNTDTATATDSGSGQGSSFSRTFRSAHSARVSWFPLVKGGVTLAILVTFVVYHFVLRPVITSGALAYAQFSPADIFLHYCTPLMTLADWIFFDVKGKYRAWYPLAWISIPLAYGVFTLVRAELGPPFGGLSGRSRYPYFFLDLDRLGWGALAYRAGLLLAGVILLGYAFVALDASLARFEVRR